MRRLLLHLLLLFPWGLVQSQNLTSAEYFFNTDPGVGQATPLTITAGAQSELSFNISTSALTAGFHSFNYRVRNAAGVWSHTAARSFFILTPNIPPVAATLRRAEYFIDQDPGQGKGTTLPITTAGTITPTIIFNTTGLTNGFHTINFRTEDNLGRWSHYMGRSFFIITPSTLNASPNIVKAEYFFNTDPGVGKGTPLSIVQGPTQDRNFLIDLSQNQLTSGFQNLLVRFFDDNGQWSHSVQRSFFVLPANHLAAKNIVAAEYFIDTNPELNPSTRGTPIPITASPALDQNYIIDLTGVASGNHLLYVRVKDNEGFWSTSLSDDFIITACVPPPVPAAADQKRCNDGTVTFTASGGVNTQTYRWYDDALTTTTLATGASFTSPSLSNDRSYFVSIYDPATLCESGRKEVKATITKIPKPVVNPSGEITFCDGNSVFLSAPAGFSQYTWSDGSTTRQILVSAAGEYTVKAGDGTCESIASDPVKVNVIAAPAKPVITITGNTTICGTGTVELSAPAGLIYRWSNGATTASITVSQTGVYFVTVRSPENCVSLPSEPVVVTVLTPPCGTTQVNNPPQITSSPLASQIEGSISLDLSKIVTDPDNNIDYSTLRVVGNSTTRGVPATIDQNYNLTINYAGNPFSGADRITIEVCDLQGACTQQLIDIDVVGDIIVYNGLTPDGDGYNDFMLIRYIDALEGGLKNKVTIYNRWGDIVFQINGYNNSDRVFTGRDKNGNELPSGTYFYTVEIANRPKAVNGYLTLLR